MDVREKKSLSEDMVMSDNKKKFCTDCNTSKTPLWRGGPAGPKSLCNACGISYRKKRRAMFSFNKGLEKKKKERSNSSQITSSSSMAKTDNVGENEKSIGKFNGLNHTFKIRLLELGSEVLLHRSSSSSTSFSSLFSKVVKKQRCQRKKKLGEEEQAAFSLMALSCGSIFA